jgi:hypothetical protein
LEARFLEDHVHYGGRIHEATARALMSGLSEGSEIAVGHGLYLRLFNEYASSLETLGAWGWTFRNRRDYRLFIDAFLAYPHDAPHNFFQAARAARSLVRLLRLPRKTALLQAMQAGFPDWSKSECEQALDECVHALNRSAETYLRDDQVILSTHNKGKHGATMFRTDDLNEREFYVLAPDLRPGLGTSRYSPRKFNVNREMITTLVTNIQNTSATIRFLAGLARSLQRTGLLEL